MHSKSYLVVAFVCLLSNIHAQKFENLAVTPPMGWNSWNTFQTNISEQLVKDIADAFVLDGYKAAGYQYIVFDDGWMAKERDAQGNLVPNPQKFPHGIKALADYIHSKGLKIGIYNCAGDKTCGGYPGSRGHEYQDALLYASWGIDYLKYDWCNVGKLNAEEAYKTMSDALYATKRPMVFSLCEWGDNKPWLWAAPIGHLWRTTGDIYPCFDCEVNHGSWSSWGVMRIVDMRKDIRKYAGAGHWNDPDMLEVGNGMTVSEDRAHFALWCMLAAPLIMGNDVRKATKETKAIITNRELIAVDQDSLGIQAFRYSQKDSLEVWVKPLFLDNWAICFINTGRKAQQLVFNWKDQSITDTIFKKTLNTHTQIYKLKDLYKGDVVGTTQKPLQTSIPGHDVLMVRLTK